MVLRNFEEAEKTRAKEQVTLAYNQAAMVAQFVGLSMNGKPLPKLYDLFPALRDDYAQQQADEQQYKAMMLLKEQFMSFANTHNKQRRLKAGGDGL